jgi:hypothetical protein
MATNKTKIIKLTEEELAKIQLEWLERGRKQVEKEFGKKIAELLCLYDVFETKDEDD